ncbi:MAG: hypothetical protein IJI50_07160 [Ruminococcus sp.]|nr:hypothetical protein [Ruminococcus sp.]
MKVEKVVICVKSMVNGDKMYNEYVGEYAYENGGIIIKVAYTLHDASDQDAIHGTQSIDISFRA